MTINVRLCYLGDAYFEGRHPFYMSTSILLLGKSICIFSCIALAGQENTDDFGFSLQEFIAALYFSRVQITGPAL
jgi:hypothetical protein